MADKKILQANEKANEEAAGGAAPEEIGDVHERRFCRRFERIFRQ